MCQYPEKKKQISMLDFVKSYQIVHSVETGKRERAGRQGNHLSSMRSDDDVKGLRVERLLNDGGKPSG